jgi:Flp pilus assembly pilin Flp
MFAPAVFPSVLDTFLVRCVLLAMGSPPNSRPTCRRLAFLRRLARDDQGQDVIEYGLLTAFIGIVGIAAWDVIETNLGNAYANYLADVQNRWETPDPGGAP